MAGERYILGIETSCDETAAAVIEVKSKQVFLKSNIISSSLDTHARTGGIIPENAAREQIRYILPVIGEALKKANIDFSEINAVGLTYGPGLIGSLLVGVETVRTISYIYGMPIIPVNHMLGHIYANWIENPNIAFPAMSLVVSGGHTDLLLMTGHGKFKLLGGTRDDAAGECFDKCARLLGYDYPGGPKIAELAQKGNPKTFQFPRPMIGSHDFEFSFSGLKTSFLNTTKEHFSVLRNDIPNSKAGWDQVVEDKLSNSEKQTLYDLCASLQEAIVDVLVKKTLKAAMQYNAKSILLSGGVAANRSLRDRFSALSSKSSIKFFVPEKNLCTDNAAMIASAAFYNYSTVDWKNVTANPQLYFT